jgi:Skp family chaperone for outer membrane proteins
MRKLFTAFVAVVALSFAFASCNESKENAEAAAIDSFLCKYDTLVQKAEAAKTLEEKEALMPEWEKMGEELKALTGKLSEEQQKKLDELNERANKAEMVVAIDPAKQAECAEKAEETEAPAEETEAPAEQEEAPAQAEQ